MSKNGSESLSSSGALGGNRAGAQRQDSPMVDEMFDGMDVVDSVVAEDMSHSNAAGGQSSLLSELASNDRTVHADFHNKFGCDLFDDDDLN